MRFLGFAVVASAFVLGACGGADSAADTDTLAADTAATTTADAGTTGATGAMAPITGETHEVKMIGDAQGFRFDPVDITIKQGDGIRFVFVNGGPHNVAFDAAQLSPEARTALIANMPEQQGELSGKMLMAEGETYTISFAGVPTGKYEYVCTPHIAMNMKGTITIQ